MKNVSRTARAQTVVEREARALPVAASSRAAELAEDAGLVLVLPLPDALDEFLAAEVVAGLLLLLRRCSRSTTACVAMPAWSVPGIHSGVVALHAPPADQHVLQRVVERVAHVQGAGHVRRRDDDGVRLARRVGLGCGSSRCSSQNVSHLLLGFLAGRTPSASSVAMIDPQIHRRVTESREHRESTSCSSLRSL